MCFFLESKVWALKFLSNQTMFAQYTLIDNIYTLFFIVYGLLGTIVHDYLPLEKMRDTNMNKYNSVQMFLQNFRQDNATKEILGQKYKIFFCPEFSYSCSSSSA